MTDRSSAKRIYVDANAFIYAIEGNDEISSALHRLFTALRFQQEPACTSELTLAEVLPRANVVQRRSYFTLLLHSGLFEMIPVTREILIETADYRRNRMQPSPGTRGVMPKLADEIHVVSAIMQGVTPLYRLIVACNFHPAWSVSGEKVSAYSS